MYRWDNGHMDAGWGIALMLGMMGIWVLIAIAIVWLVLSTRTHPVPPPAPHNSVIQTAEQILAERLARGEIDPAEYKERLNALTASPPRP
jgi:putative membrane protein